MTFVTPAAVNKKAERVYKQFLAAWIRGESDDFFPHRLRVSLTPERDNPAATIAATQLLMQHSKSECGWGYTVHREQVASRDFGNNQFPKSITIDSLTDLLRLSGQKNSFDATRHVVASIRERLPQLEDWLSRSINSLAKHSDAVEGLIATAEFFLANPWPDCYARQIPTRVDTKFVQRNHAVLRQWLDQLLPAGAIDVNETKFERRFGLKDGQPHRGIRLLDRSFSEIIGVAFSELSLPLTAIASLTVSDATVFIVENDLNLVTLPSFERAIGIRGAGNAVNRLERIKWLHDNRVFYWGDIDVDGFVILSRLRNLFPHVQSILMDKVTMTLHRDWVVEGNRTTPTRPTNLSDEESEAFDLCSRNNMRLEQEKILQAHVNQAFDDLSLH